MLLRLTFGLQLALAFNSETLDNLAAALAEVVSLVANGWHAVLNLPEIVQLNFKFPTGHVLAKDVVSLVDKFTQPPYCPGESGLMRSLTFTSALSVLLANTSSITGDVQIKLAMDRLIDGWKRHEDGAVQCLAETFKL